MEGLFFFLDGSVKEVADASCGASARDLTIA